MKGLISPTRVSGLRTQMSPWGFFCLFFVFLLKYLLVFGCAGSSLLRGLSLIAVSKLLTLVASFAAERRPWGARA